MCDAYNRRWRHGDIDDDGDNDDSNDDSGWQAKKNAVLYKNKIHHPFIQQTGKSTNWPTDRTDHMRMPFNIRQSFIIDNGLKIYGHKSWMFMFISPSQSINYGIRHVGLEIIIWIIITIIIDSNAAVSYVYGRKKVRKTESLFVCCELPILHIVWFCLRLGKDFLSHSLTSNFIY